MILLLVTNVAVAIISSVIWYVNLSSNILNYSNPNTKSQSETIIINLQPQIKKEDTLPDAHWKCKKCFDCEPKAPKEIKKSMVKPNIRKVCSGRDQPLPPPEDTTKLPYDVSIFLMSMISDAIVHS